MKKNKCLILFSLINNIRQKLSSKTVIFILQKEEVYARYWDEV